MFLSLLLACLTLTAQQPAAQQEPPEEDVSATEVKEYVLNPLQAAKELRVGAYYFKKGSYRAAARRFEEATKWDPNSGEAWMKLGEARMKAGAAKEAREAYAKFLELQPEGKDADNVRKILKKR